MQRVYVLVAFSFLVALPIAISVRLNHDLRHPEGWDQEPWNDPRIYLPLWGVVAALAGLLLWEVRRQRAIDRRFRKVRKLLDFVMQKQSEGKWQEASTALREVERLTGWRDGHVDPKNLLK